MQTLTVTQSEQASGGILWTTPAAIALADSACFGPLVGAFGAGWAVGTFIYSMYMSE